MNLEMVTTSVYILILNYNGWQDTVECLESVQGLTYPVQLCCSRRDSITFATARSRKSGEEHSEANRRQRVQDSPGQTRA